MYEHRLSHHRLIITPPTALTVAANGTHGALWIGSNLYIVSNAGHTSTELPSTGAAWRAATWSVDSSTLFAVDAAATLHAFDSAGNAIRTWRHTAAASSIAAWGTCVYLSGAGKGVVVVVDADSGAVTRMQVLEMVGCC